MTAAASIPAPEGRCDKRTNIFLGATLRFDGRTAAVRVRDLSAQGAQVEGTVLPDRDGRATLERGSVLPTASLLGARWIAAAFISAPPYRSLHGGPAANCPGRKRTSIGRSPKSARKSPLAWPGPESSWPNRLLQCLVRLIRP